MNGGSTVLDAQLRALRAQLLATDAFLDLLFDAQDAPAAPSGCPHIETENIGTMGHPARQCRNCHAVITLPPQEVGA